MKIEPKNIMTNFVPIGEVSKGVETGMNVDDTPSVNNPENKTPTPWDDIQGIDKADDNANKREIFAQNSAPATNYKDGDLWFDTDDSNHLYRANSALSWVSVKDGTIFSGDWDDITGATKPDDNATVGATFGTNIAGGGTGNTQTGNDGYTTLFRQDKFGDGSDGNVTISSNTTLTSDMYYDVLIINTGVTLNTGGYRVFCKTSLTTNGTGKIIRDGVDGGNGADGVGRTSPGAGGTPGAALADGTIQGALAGEPGGIGGNGGLASKGSDGTAGDAGVNETTSLGDDGVAGAAGGNGGNIGFGGSVGGAAGIAGTITAPAVEPKNLTSLIINHQILGGTATPYESSASSGGSGGGGGGDGDAPGEIGGSGGGGGASGGVGGIVLISSKTIVNNGTMSANGGAGGDGGDGAAKNPGDNAFGGAGGGAGSGGSGGIVILIYESLTNNGTISASGGAAGAIGSGTDGSANGGAGTNGNAGTILQIEV
jgi:hypothetical protein